MAARVHGKNRIVRDTVNQQAITQFGKAALAEIASYFAEADEAAIIIAEAGDDYVRPETASIFAHPPTFIFKAPHLRSDAQFVVRLTCRKIGVGAENAEMFSEDLFGFVLF